MLTGGPPGTVETDKVLARRAEAGAPAGQKVAPHLLQGLGMQGGRVCAHRRPSPSLLVPERLRRGGWAVRDPGRARGPKGVARLPAPADFPTLGGHGLL